MIAPMIAVYIILLKNMRLNIANTIKMGILFKVLIINWQVKEKNKLKIANT